MNNSSVLIICVTVIISVLIVSCTFILINDDGSDIVADSLVNSGSFLNIMSKGHEDVAEEVSNSPVDKRIKVNSVTFYSDGNPNTGESATINVGKEFVGETVQVLTLYSRDGVRQNYPSGASSLVVDDDGNVVITDYTAMPRYPGYCYIELRYKGQVYKCECDIGTYKGTQTSIPRIV